MDLTREADTYTIQRVSFGAKLSGTIATVSLGNTAEMNQQRHPKVARIVKDNSYMDDIIDSVKTSVEVRNSTQEIDDSLSKHHRNLSKHVLFNRAINGGNHFTLWKSLLGGNLTYLTMWNLMVLMGELVRSSEMKKICHDDSWKWTRSTDIWRWLYMVFQTGTIKTSCSIEDE